MAILKAGVNGPFSGRVGNIVGYELNGQAIIRSLRSKSKKRKPTPLEKINRGRMKAVSEFLKPLKMYIEFGYRHLSPAGSRVGPFQLAQSYIFRHAIDYDADTVPYVNPEKALIFRGDTATPQEVVVKRTGNLLQFRWRAEKVTGLRFIALAYVVNEYGILHEDGAQAGTGELEWEIPTYLANKSNIHIYVAFHFPVTGNLSDSVYMGCY